MKLAEALLGLACAALAGVVALEWREPQVKPAAGAALRPKPLPSPAEPAAPLPLQRFDEVVARAIFEPARRLAVEEASTEPGGPADLREVALVGVLIMPGLRIAFLRDKTPEEIVRLEAGSSLGRWTLADVRPNGVTLRSGSTTRELRLHEEVEPPAPDGRTLPSPPAAWRPMLKRGGASEKPAPPNKAFH